MHVFEISYDQLKLVNFSIEIIHSGKHYIIVITPVDMELSLLNKLNSSAHT